MYVWVVRRWFKGDDRSLVEKGLVGLGIQGLPGSGSGGDGGGAGREKLREKRRREREQEFGSRTNSASTSRRSSFVPPQAQGASELAPPQHQHPHPSSSNTSLQTEEDSAERKKKNRLSSISIGSVGASSDGHGAGGGGLFRRGSRKQRGAPTPTGDSDGEDSDPEDSETPWGCTVKVRRLTGSGKGEPLKVKVGTLSPTPHHPKVVAMLKVPFPLPDVEVDKLALRKREGGKVIPPAGDGHGAGLVLTAEEIKDVICSTGMWIVVREGFGGVGKVSRKGDGWRIRA
ncbi:hypothetical protein V5O48_006644 [Marasmius crinis-equi]|uniref:Uncharacterized protein n=1 Tax=Marasmius crinis-equi TaxID=585013 RepID=A0ABR3FJC0_9AGAR